jgi:amino acid transporter
MTPTEPAFTRQKSGYIREFDTKDVFIINVLGYSIGLAVCTTPAFVGGFAPTAQLWLVVLLGATLAFFNGVTYGIFGGLMPSTGGDYNFVGRTLHHALGFIANWGFTIANAFGLAFNLVAFFKIGLGPALISVGYSYATPALVDVGQQLTSSTTSFACGVLLLVVLVLVVLSGRSFHRVVLYSLFTGASFGSLVMLYVLWTNSPSDFIRGFNSLVGELSGAPNAYQNVLGNAAAAGLTLDAPPSLRAALHALPLGFLCFVGFNYSVYLGGEVRRPLRSQSIGIIAALVVGVLGFVLLMGRLQYVVGRDFLAALGSGDAFLQANGVPSASTNLLVGAMLPKGSWLNLAMQIGNLLWFVSVPIVILQVCVRNVLAWTFDEMFFHAMRRRTKRSFAPWVAICFVGLLGLVWMIVNTYVTSASLVGSAALLAIPSALTGIAAFALPARRQTLWANAPAGVRHFSIGGVNLFPVIGLACAAGSSWMVWEAVKLEGAAPGGPAKVLGYIGAVYGLGICVYLAFWQRFVRRIPGGREGVRTFLREIPAD